MLVPVWRYPVGCVLLRLADCKQSAHERGKFVNPTHRLPLPPQEIFLVLISVRGWVDPSTMV